jgi:hypothetical protein
MKLNNINKCISVTNMFSMIMIKLSLCIYSIVYIEIFDTILLILLTSLTLLYTSAMLGTRFLSTVIIVFRHARFYSRKVLAS